MTLHPLSRGKGAHYTRVHDNRSFREGDALKRRERTVTMLINVGITITRERERACIRRSARAREPTASLFAE